MRIRLFFALLGILYVSLLFAVGKNDIRFSHLNQNDGLSNSTVFAICQDKENNMWFATYDGVNRYDGYDFVTYRHDLKDESSIASDIIRCFLVDDKDRLWIGTREGMSLYDKYTDSFNNYYYKSYNKNLSVLSIVQLDDDLLLLATELELVLFDVKTHRFCNDTFSVPMKEMVATVIYKDGTRVLIGTNSAVYSYCHSTGKLEQLFKLDKKVTVNSILSDHKKNIIIGTEGDGLYMYNGRTKRIRHYKHTGDDSGLVSNYVRSLMYDKDRNLWIGTYNGLNIYDESIDRFMTYRHSELSPNGLSQNSVRSLFCDSQGGVWLGTYWGGVDYYHPLCNRFTLMNHSATINSISDNVVNCVVEDQDQNLWIGTNNGGLNFLHRETSTFKKYGIQSSSITEDIKDVKTVFVDPDDHLVYVGAHAGGLMVLDTRTGHATFYNKENHMLPSNNIYSILSEPAKGLWIASLDFLIYYDKEHKLFKTITHDAEGHALQNGSRVLFRDSKNRLWIGGEYGVSVYKTDGEKLQQDKSFYLTEMVASSFVNCIFESASGSLWIGTRNGLFEFMNNGDSYHLYTTEQGLPNNIILGILEDKKGQLWISTNKGLCNFNPKSKVIKNFNVLDGIQGNQFCSNSCCLLKNGDMLFGGINGITKFRPETLVENPYAPSPVINHLFVFNKEVLPGDDTKILGKNIAYTHMITLNASQNSFALSFVVTNYVSGSHNMFSYKLEGYDKEWIKRDDIRQVSYTNLPAGNYTFKLLAANTDGKWCESPAVLKIRILPEWYLTWWAILLFICLAGSLAVIVVRFFWQRKLMKAELNMERIDKERMEEVNQMKIRFYVNISHELKTPLTLIIAPLQELLDNVKNQWEREQLLYIKSNASRLLYLVNQEIDFRRAELDVFAFTPSYANAYQCLLTIFMNYESIAKRRNIDYSFITDLQDSEFFFDSNYLELIVNNLLSNAFKYTPDGRRISMKLYKQNNNLIVQVIDTGQGIEEKKQSMIFERFYRTSNDLRGSGIGLSLVNRLVQLHHGVIGVESELNQGTTFTVCIPQNRDAYKDSELQHTESEQKEEDFGAIENHPIYVEDADVLIENELKDDYEELTNRGNILVVEDNNELRRFLVNSLSRLFNVTEACNGQIAMDKLKEVKIDLIITDVMMPVVDGLKLCKMVKQNFNTSHIPVFFLSAKSDLENQLKGLGVGADDYIAKPFDVKVLTSKVFNVLKTQHRIYEMYSRDLNIEPEKVTNNALDESFLKQAMAVVEKNLDNVEFSTELFASQMNMSRSNLHLKLKALTGKSAIDFIHRIRFNHACRLLKEGKYTVSEVSYMVGYNTPSYFTTSFKKYVGCLPNEYVKK